MGKIVDMASVDLLIPFARVKRRFDTKGTMYTASASWRGKRVCESSNIDGDYVHGYKNIGMGKNVKDRPSFLTYARQGSSRIVQGHWPTHDHDLTSAHGRRHIEDGPRLLA